MAMKMHDDPKTIETAGRALQQAMEISQLHTALAAKDAEIERLRTYIGKLMSVQHGLVSTLQTIAMPLECGCRPCTGSCRSREALQIHIDCLRDAAANAIANLSKTAPPHPDTARIDWLEANGCDRAAIAARIADFRTSIADWGHLSETESAAAVSDIEALLQDSARYRNALKSGEHPCSDGSAQRHWRRRGGGVNMQTYIATEMAIPNSPDCRRTSERVYLVREADAALAAKDARIQELQKEAAANHKILQQALDGCDRVDAESAAKDAEIERLQRAVEWLLDSTVTRNSEGQLVNWCGPGRVEIAAEFAEIIKPASGERNG